MHRVLPSDTICYVFSVLIPILLLASGCEPERPPSLADTGENAYYAPDQPGPFTAGVLMMEIMDPRGKEMTVEVWYPAIVGEGATPDDYGEIALSLNGYRDAIPAQAAGPFPLVAFSHGFAGIRYQSAFLTEHLATHGMVVVAPDHRYNTFLDLNEDHVVDVLLERPDDIRYAVDAVLARSESDDFFLGDMVDITDGYAVVGHSFGSYTSMVIAGGVLDPGYAETHCQEQGSPICRYLDQFAPELLEGHGTSDERAVVSVPISPGLWYLFGEGGAGLSSVRSPLVLGGDKDQVLSYDREGLPSYQAMPLPRTLATYIDGGHYAPFSNSCDFAAPLFDDCTGVEGGWIDIAPAQAATLILVTAYLKDQLIGDRRYTSSWMVDALPGHPEVILEHAMPPDPAP